MNDYGRRGGTSPNVGKKAMTYRCPHPVTGEPVYKKRFKRDPDSPVAVWSQYEGTWHLDAIIDAKDLPRWVKRGYLAGNADPVEK